VSAALLFSIPALCRRMPKEIAQSMPATNDQCADQEEQISQARPLELGILTDADGSKEDKPSASPGDNSPHSAPNPRHLEGWRLYTLIFGQATFPLLLRMSTNIISQIMSQSSPVNSRNNHRQHIAHLHNQRSPRFREQRLDRNFLPPNITGISSISIVNATMR
jgi:hypothetical protein